MAITHTEEALSNACNNLLDNVKQLTEDLSAARSTKKDKETLDTIDGILKANTRDISNLVDNIKEVDKNNTLPNKSSNKKNIEILIKNKLFLKYIRLI